MLIHEYVRVGFMMMMARNMVHRDLPTLAHHLRRMMTDLGRLDA